MAYATVEQVEERLGRTMSQQERSQCAVGLDDAALLIDSIAPCADLRAKQLVSCRMVMRTLADGQESVPLGASQGSMSALGYTQSWTIGSGGAAGELYISKTDRRLLGLGNRIGSYSPVQELVRGARND